MACVKDNNIYFSRFSFCFENNIKTYACFFCEMLYFSYAEISLKNKKEFDILEGANPIFIFFELMQFVLILILISPSCFCPWLMQFVLIIILISPFCFCLWLLQFVQHSLEYPEKERCSHYQKKKDLIKQR